MAENIDEEKLPDPEIPPDTSQENISANDTASITPKHETENMEVHHHHDLHHKNKRWKEYLLEFLMIFLAVTMGFFAESLRENINNKERLHNYINSLVSDLQSDVVMYDSAVAFNNIHKQMIDTIIVGLSTPAKDIRKVYFMARELTMGSSVVSPGTKTFEQMKSSGDIRLIRNQFIADSIGLYYQWLKKFDYWSDLQRQRISDLISVNDKAFNASVFYKIIKNTNIDSVPADADIITHDPALLNNVIMKHQYYFGMLNLMNQRCEAAKLEATQLIKMLQKEYHLDN